MCSVKVYNEESKTDVCIMLVRVGEEQGIQKGGPFCHIRIVGKHDLIFCSLFMVCVYCVGICIMLCGHLYKK